MCVLNHKNINNILYGYVIYVNSIKIIINHFPFLLNSPSDEEEENFQFRVIGVDGRMASKVHAGWLSSSTTPLGFPAATLIKATRILIFAHLDFLRLPLQTDDAEITGVQSNWGCTFDKLKSLLKLQAT